MPPRPLVSGLRLLLGVAFAATVFAGVRAVPAMYDDWVREAPVSAAARWPVLVVALLVLLCVLVVIVCVWRLLTMVTHDRIFSGAAFRWVDVILWSIAAAWVLLFSAFVYSVGRLDLAAGPSVALMLVLVVAAVIGLLMVVMRALLRQATTLREDMEAVI